jgi:hypothetical protein
VVELPDCVQPCPKRAGGLNPVYFACRELGAIAGGLWAVAALVLAIGNVQARPKQHLIARPSVTEPQPADAISPFWSPNPELELSTDETANLEAYGRKPYGPVKYILLGPEWESKDDAKVTEFRHGLYDQGYVRLGGITFQRETDGKGDTPQKEQAIAFAHKIGADIIIYRARTYVDSSNKHFDYHSIGFYAKKLGNISLTAQP